MTLDAHTWHQLTRIANAIERIADAIAPIPEAPADDAPVHREHELLKIDGIPIETYPFLPTGPEADTQPIEGKPEDEPCED